MSPEAIPKPAGALTRDAWQMCVQHMKANNLTWPKDWDDLKGDFAACRAQSGQSWSFADLRLER